MSRIEELEKRLGADPNSRIFVQLAEEYRKAGLLEQAIEVCENGLQKHPQYPSARVALGRALLEAESYDRASQEFETVLQQVPDNILAHKFLGETYQRLGRMDEALQKYETAHTLAPEDPELEERINEVKSAIQGRGSAPAPPPPGLPEPPDELEPTLFEGPPVSQEQGVVEPPGPPKPPEPSPAPPVRDPAAVTPSLEDDLAPIPLVDVDEPMILEDRFAAPPATPKPTPPPPAPAPSPEATKAAAPAPDPVPVATPPAPEPFFALDPEPAPVPVPPPPPPPPVPVASSPPPTPPAVAPPGSAATTSPGAPDATRDMETRTMAELYASQGHLDKAVDVYQRLLEKSPGNIEYRTRVDELTMLLQATHAGATATPPPRPRDDEPMSPSDGATEEARRKTIAVLEEWLSVIRKSKEA